METKIDSATVDRELRDVPPMLDGRLAWPISISVISMLRSVWQAFCRLRDYLGKKHGNLRIVDADSVVNLALDLLGNADAKRGVHEQLATEVATLRQSLTDRNAEAADLRERVNSSATRIGVLDNLLAGMEQCAKNHDAQRVEYGAALAEISDIVGLPMLPLKDFVAALKRDRKTQADAYESTLRSNTSLTQLIQAARNKLAHRTGSVGDFEEQIYTAVIMLDRKQDAEAARKRQDRQAQIERVTEERRSEQARRLHDARADNRMLREELNRARAELHHVNRFAWKVTGEIFWKSNGNETAFLIINGVHQPYQADSVHLRRDCNGKTVIDIGVADREQSQSQSHYIVDYHGAAVLLDGVPVGRAHELELWFNSGGTHPTQINIRTK